MSFVLFKDSFEAWKQATFGDADLRANFFSRYTNGTLNNLASISSNGRNGQCITIGRGSGGFFKSLEHSSRWVTGFAYRIDGAAGNVDPFYSIANNQTALFTLLQATDGTLVIEAGATIIAVTERALLGGRWYFLECDVEFSGSSPIMCTAELRINGHVEASGTASTGTPASSLLSLAANANVHNFSPLAGVGSGNSFDDLYIKNEAGYEGDIRDTAVYPAADGGISDWTPNSGSDHFNRVNTHPVDLTKFLSTATPGDIDLWTFDPIPSFSGTVLGINIRVLARKDDEGTKSFKIVVGATGTDAESNEFFVSDVTPEYYEFSLKLDPATGLAWVPGQVITAGVKLIS